ncbi:MAG: hypothetical protein GY873_02475 [Bosea sp.]|uniref:hypothetical protein n=1 Tax=Bosea sp. (in: a-proteobacteria) TaxID=1871050 RepID=UPI00239CC3D2|nr:hypothetical protein [Bosea sp. (in: a-proteobacteria)]
MDPNDAPEEGTETTWQSGALPGDPPTITLRAREPNGHPVEVTATLEPPPFSAAYALGVEEQHLDNGGVIVGRMAAALFLCWPGNRKWPIRPRPRPWRPRQRMEEYGLDILDALIEAGAVPSEVLDAALVAYKYAQQTGITEREVAAAEGFSGAPGAG